MSRFAVALCLVVSDCSLPTTPTADGTGVLPADLELMEQRSAVTLCVTNPNLDALVVRQVTVSLNVAGTPMASGSSTAPIRLAASSARRVPFTIVTRVKNTDGQIMDVAKARLVRYSVHGSVALDGALGLGVPYDRSGRFDESDAGPALSAPDGAPSSRCLRSDIAVPL